MIVVSAAVALGCAVALAVFALIGMERAATNLANAANADYKQTSTNWGALLLAIIAATIMLGTIGVGPLADLAGVVTVQTLR